jgi:D-alanine-D-alanine ligase
MTQHSTERARSTVIGVLTGGRSQERDRSLLSGEAVCAALDGMAFTLCRLDTAQPGFVEALKTIDLAFLAIAGRGAEDGLLQGFLETLGVPYTGSGVRASALAMHKPTAKTLVSRAGVRVVPQARIPAGLSIDLVAAQIEDELGLPVIVKPESEGGSVGIAVAHDRTTLVEIIAKARAEGARGDEADGGGLFAERFVAGRSVTVGVLERDGELRALPILETKTGGDFYDYHAKRDPDLHEYVCPAALSEPEAAALSASAIQAHRSLGCRGYSRSDFVLRADSTGVPGIAYWLEINTLPGLSREGNLATMALAAGMTYEDLITFILRTGHARAGAAS